MRKAWLAVTGTFVLLTLVSATALLVNPAIDIPVALIRNFLFLWVLIRYGVLASAGGMLVAQLDAFAVLRVDFTNWYAGRSWMVVMLIAAVFVYAFWISLGRKRAVLG